MSTFDQPGTAETAVNAAPRPARNAPDSDRCAPCAGPLPQSPTSPARLPTTDTDRTDEPGKAPPADDAAARGRILLQLYRSLPGAVDHHDPAPVAVQDAIADLLHVAYAAGGHPGAVMLGTVRNAFEETTGHEGAIQAREYLTLRVTRRGGGPANRRRALPVQVTVMRTHAIQTPTSFSEPVHGFGDDLGDHDSPEFLSEAVCEAGWRLWDQATGQAR